MRSRRQQCTVVLGLVLAMCGAAVAEEVTTQMNEVVVTATRDEVPIEQVGSSITVVTAKEIEQKQARTVADVLRAVPGLGVVRTGTSGGTTSVFMRGADARHTLIMIDGVELNDPSTTGGEYNFAHLTPDNIEQIEVLRGPQSTLYGSQAIGGIINIITKRGSGKPTGFALSEAGSFSTFRESAGISGGNSLVNYALTASRVDSKGTSSAGSNYGNQEKDGYQNSSVAARVGVTPTNNSELDLHFRYTSARVEADNGGGAGKDDPNRIMHTEELQFRTQGWLSLFNETWEQKLGVSVNKLTRSDDNDPDTAHPVDLLRSTYHGQTVKLDWQHVVKLHRTNALTLGLETREERADSTYYSENSFGPYSNVWSEHAARTSSLYLQDQLTLWDAWFSTAGVRIDEHSQFGSEATYRFTSAYHFKQSGTKIKGSYGTGFKAPSLFQLYDPANGNTNLKPEESVGWDLGIEQKLADNKVNLGVVYFNNDFKQLIDWQLLDPVWFTGMYNNIARAESSGIEATASFQPIDDLSVRTAYTYTRTKDKTTGLELLRRPKNRISCDITYRFLAKGSINIGMVYVGKREDLVYVGVTPTRVPLKDYTLVNLAAAYDVTKNLQLFGRIDNLFDREYEEVAGYGTPGIAAYGGIKVLF